MAGSRARASMEAAAPGSALAATQALVMEWMRR